MTFDTHFYFSISSTFGFTGKKFLQAGKELEEHRTSRSLERESAREETRRLREAMESKARDYTEEKNNFSSIKMELEHGACYEMIVLATIKYLYYQTYIYKLLLDSLSIFLTDCMAAGLERKNFQARCESAEKRVLEIETNLESTRTELSSTRTELSAVVSS